MGKSSTAIGAKYIEANRDESPEDFTHKIGIVVKEAAEIQYSLELFDEAKIGDPHERRWLLRDLGEPLAVFTSIGKHVKPR